MRLRNNSIFWALLDILFLFSLLDIQPCPFCLKFLAGILNGSFIDGVDARIERLKYRFEASWNYNDMDIGLTRQILPNFLGMVGCIAVKHKESFMTANICIWFGNFLQPVFIHPLSVPNTLEVLRGMCLGIRRSLGLEVLR